MKQYLSPEQTAKLIELGFAEPKSEVKAEQAGDYAWYNPAYSIGELIEMLPRAIIVGCTMTKRLMFSLAFYGWEIGYLGMGMEEPIVFQRAEFIDAIYDMIIRLKEEGVI
jgi:hypothetical protein